MDLELKIISATDLTKSNPFSSKLRAYAVVSISGAALPSQKTPVDSDGGRNPNWNHPLKFSLPGSGADNLTLKFRIHSQRSFAADNLVGEVCVPLQDLLDSASVGKIPSPVNFVSYQVKKPSDRPNGVLTFSYRFNDKISGEGPPEELVVNFPAKLHTTSVVYPAPADVYPPPATPHQPEMGYPAVDGYSYDVYPPPAAIPVKGQTSYGYPAQGAYEYGYPAQTGYGYPGQTGYGYNTNGSGYGYIRV